MKMFIKRTSAVFVLFFLSAAFCFGQDIPARPQGYVSDFAGVLSAQERGSIESLSVELEKKTSVQMAVVTVSSTKPDTIEQYAVKLFERWGIGSKDKNDGVLLLVAVSDREARIEVGYGLEGFLTDATSKIIIERYMLPYFRQGLYGQGAETGVAAVVSVLAKSYEVTITGREQQVYDSIQQARGQASNNLGSILFFIFILVLFILNPRLFFYMMLFSSLGGGRRGYWSGGGGGYGGGFGGFGGGMSGGGGASGRW